MEVQGRSAEAFVVVDLLGIVKLVRHGLAVWNTKACGINCCIMLLIIGSVAMVILSMLCNSVCCVGIPSCHSIDMG